MSQKVYNFENSLNYNYDDTKIEIVNGVARLKKLTPINETFYANYNTDINGSRGLGVLTGTANGGASVSGGKLDLAHNDLRYIEYNAQYNADSLQTGCVRFKVTPNFNITPATEEKYFSIMQTTNNYTNVIYLRHRASGDMRLQLHDSSGLIVEIYGYPNFILGQTYEVEVNWDITNGATRIFIDGTQLGATHTGTGIRTDARILRVGTGVHKSSISNFKIDDFQVFSTVQHTENYTPCPCVECSYCNLNPTIYPKESWNPTSPLTMLSFVETLGAGNEGNVGYQISQDAGVTWKYWNGVSWSVSPVAIEDINWVNAENVDIDGNSLTKTGSIGWNAGASSNISFSGDGGVQFTAIETNTHRMCGLSSFDANKSYASIEHAIYLYVGATFHVFENGVGKGHFGNYQTGDIFSVERSDSTIYYKKNGIIFYTSLIQNNKSLIVDTSLYDIDSTINNVQFINIGKYNNAATLNSVLSNLTLTAPFDNLITKSILISNGEQKVELDHIVIEVLDAINDLNVSVDFPRQIVKSDTFNIKCQVNQSIFDWKIRAEIVDNSGHSIKLANTASGGSDLQIDIIDQVNGMFFIKVVKDLTTNFDDNVKIEVEIENNAGKVFTLWKYNFEFKNEELTWETP